VAAQVQDQGMGLKRRHREEKAKSQNYFEARAKPW